MAQLLRGPICGSYVLILRLLTERSLRIGRLGVRCMPAGYYAYAGSALGPGGIVGRLRHHLRPAVRPHWHIDYLRGVAQIEQVWWGPGTLRREHDWAALLGCLPGATAPVPRFGASDCHCPTHLFHFPEPPCLEAFRRLMRERFPGVEEELGELGGLRS